MKPEQATKVRFNPLGDDERIADKLPGLLEELFSDGCYPESFLGLILFNPLTGSLKVRSVGLVPQREVLLQIYNWAAEAVAQIYESSDSAEKIEDPDEPVLN